MGGQQVGYTRVSSLDQNPDRQLDGVAVDRTFTDSASGRSTARPQLEAMLAFVRGDDNARAGWRLLAACHNLRSSSPTPEQPHWPPPEGSGAHGLSPGTHPTRHGKHPRPELADASPPDTPHELDRYASAR